MTGATVEKRDAAYGEVAGWLAEVDTLDLVTPGEAAQAECWAVEDADGETVGMALVETGWPSEKNYEENESVAWVHRIGVLDDRQGEGFGRVLMERLREEYGPIELEVDSRKPANEFYEAIGMELVSEKPAAMHDGTEGTLNVWRWE